MGRCYDFGVSIDPSSERAMVVAPEGGRCVCPSSGAVCVGRFAGCSQILSQPGRVPPNAPAWALDPAPVAVRAEPQRIPAAVGAAVGAGASAHFGRTDHFDLKPEADLEIAPIPSRYAAVPANDRPVDVNGSRPVSVDDLAEAVVHLRESMAQNTPVVEQIADLLAEQEALRRSFGRVDEALDRMSRLESAVDRLTSTVQSFRDDIEEQAGTPDQLTRVQASIERLTKAVIEGNEQRTRPQQVSPLAFETLQETVDNTATMSIAMRNELVELVDAQARETHALRRQLTELMRRTVESTDRIAQPMPDTDDIARQIASLSDDVARLHTGSELVTATELAATINTLRGAGIEDISAAHLVHSFQVDVRELRNEIADLKGQLAAVAAAESNG